MEKPDGTGNQPKADDAATGGKTPDGAKAAGADGGKDGAAKDTSKHFTPEELQAEVDRRLESASKTIREKVQAELKAEAEKAQKLADEAKLKETGEYKTLLEAREAELSTLRTKHEELAPFKKRAEAAEAALKEYAEAEIKSLGLDKRKEILELLEGKSAVEQLGWISRHKDSLKASGGGLPGTPSDQKGEKMTPEDRRKSAVGVNIYGA